MFTAKRPSRNSKPVAACRSEKLKTSRPSRENDDLRILGAWRPSTSQSTFACETEIYDQGNDLIATGAGTFRFLKGERKDGTLSFVDQKAAD